MTCVFFISFRPIGSDTTYVPIDAYAQERIRPTPTTDFRELFWYFVPGVLSWRVAFLAASRDAFASQVLLRTRRRRFLQLAKPILYHLQTCSRSLLDFVFNRYTLLSVRP